MTIQSTRDETKVGDKVRLCVNGQRFNRLMEGPIPALLTDVCIVDSVDHESCTIGVNGNGVRYRSWVRLSSCPKGISLGKPKTARASSRMPHPRTGASVTFEEWKRAEIERIIEKGD